MLIMSLPALANILSIFLIVLLVYSLLGMQLFANVRHGEFINEDANFCTFSVACITMFRCATGEDWNGLMHDAMPNAPQARLCSEEAGDCGSYMAVPFFVSYVLLATFIILKMMIAIIIENFFISVKREASLLRQEHADIFRRVWAEFDPEASGRIHVKHLAFLVRELPPPLGLDPSCFLYGRKGSGAWRREGVSGQLCGGCR